MDRDAATAEVQRILGYRTDKQSEIETLFVHQQNELEKEAVLPWFLRFDDTSLVTVAHTDRIPQPAGYLRAWDDDAVWVKHVDEVDGLTRWLPLSKDTPKYLRQTFQDDLSAEGEGEPRAYSYVNDEFLLFPTPDDVYEMRMIYYKADQVLSTNIENKWLRHVPYLLIGRVGMRVAGAIGGKNALGVFGAFVQEGMAKIINTTTSHDIAGTRPVMGGED